MKIFLLIEEKFKDLEADLFLLPEMFTTGFYMKTQEVADEEELTLTWMKNFAKTKMLQLAEAFL